MSNTATPFRIFFVFVIFSCVTFLQAQVVINEFSAANYSLDNDNYGEYEDWIELYNNSGSPVNISNYYLSDRINNPTKWQIPSGISVPAYGHLVIWASNLDEYANGVLHAGFKLTQTRGNEAVVLANPAGTILDSISIIRPNQENHSTGRLSDGGSTWGVFQNPTQGSANTGGKAMYAATPNLSPNAGTYTGSVTVSMTSPDAGASIYYTTDGSVPTTGSNLYSGPVAVNSTQVLRAMSVSSDPNTFPSFIETNSYFVVPDTHGVYIVSIAGDQIETLLNGNQIEPIGSFELFDQNGALITEATGDFNEHGNDSWAYAQRGFDYITRDQLGYDYSVRHEIFDLKNRDKFQRLILKPGANDNYPFETGGAHIRDAFVHAISAVADLRIDERTYEPCVLYVNGQYWGVYEIREKVDDHDFTRHYYDQGRSDLEFIKTWGWTWAEYGDMVAWNGHYAFLVTADMSIPANYDSAKSIFNVGSLQDYIILNSWSVCADWLNWNTAWWRGLDPDGDKKKWRYALWDMDATFGHYINYTGVPNTGPTADPCDPESFSSGSDPQGHTQILNSFMESDEFINEYINRWADLNSSYLGCGYVIPFLDSLIDQIRPEMPRQIARWGGTMQEWEDNVSALRDFIYARCGQISGGIVDCYSVDGPYKVTVRVDPIGSGNEVEINDLSPPAIPYTGLYYGGTTNTGANMLVEFDADPAPGWVFDQWSVLNHVPTPGYTDEKINLALSAPDELTAHFIPAPCDQPYDFLTTNITEDEAKVAWTGTAGADEYQIIYRIAGQPNWDTVYVNDEDKTLDNLEPCTQYEVKVRAMCITQNSSFGNHSFTTECSSTSIGDPDLGNIESVYVYPNPFSQDLSIELSLLQAEEVSVELMSLTGQRIHAWSEGLMSPGSHVLKLHAPQLLAKGMYLVRVHAGQGTWVKRIAKM